MDREVEVLALEVLEGLEMQRGRVAGLASGDVEADHATVPVPHGRLGDLQGVGVGAHRRKEGADRETRAGRALGESGQHGLDDLVEGEALLRVERRGVPDLGVHDPVGGKVGGAFGGDPVAGIGLLHDAHRVGEGLEVEAEVAPVGTTHEPGSQLVDIGGGKAVVAVEVGQLDDGGRTEAAVEVVVQDDLRCSPDGRRIGDRG